MAKVKSKSAADNGTASAKIGKESNIPAFALVLILAVVAVYFLIQAVGNPEGDAETGNRSNSSLVIYSNAPTETHLECLGRSQMTEDVIYIYGQGCSYSQENSPWITELIAEGYSINMVETSDTGRMLAAYNCLNGIASFEGTPEYVCARTNATHLGAFSLKSEIIAFINDCK